MLDEVMTLSLIKNKVLQLHSTRDWILKTITLPIFPWIWFILKSYSSISITLRSVDCYIKKIKIKI